MLYTSLSKAQEFYYEEFMSFPLLTSMFFVCLFVFHFSLPLFHYKKTPWEMVEGALNFSYSQSNELKNQSLWHENWANQTCFGCLLMLFLLDKVLTFQLPTIFHMHSTVAILRREKKIMEDKWSVCVCVCVLGRS